MFCREWNEGLLTTLLRKLCIPAFSTNGDSKTHRVMKILQLDGEASTHYHHYDFVGRCWYSNVMQADFLLNGDVYLNVVKYSESLKLLF